MTVERAPTGMSRADRDAWSTNRVLEALSFFVALLAAAPAHAAGPVFGHCLFSWLDQTSGGSASFNVYLAIASGGPYTLVGSVPRGGSAVYQPTTNFCEGQADGQKYAVVKAVGFLGEESAPSNEVAFVLNTAKPAAPSHLSVR